MRAEIKQYAAAANRAVLLPSGAASEIGAAGMQVYGAEGQNSAQPAGLDELARPLHGEHVPDIEHNLRGDAGFFGQRGNLLCLRAGHAERLFAVDMLAGGNRLFERVIMEHIGRADVNDVNGGIVDQLVLAIAGAPDAVFLRETARALDVTGADAR